MNNEQPSSMLFIVQLVKSKNITNQGFVSICPV